MPQTPWTYTYQGDPYIALAGVPSIPGILPKEITSLQELIFHCIEVNPVCRWLSVNASLTIEPSTFGEGNQVSVLQSVLFDGVASDGVYSFAPAPSDPASLKTAINSQSQIAQYPRWSWHNAADQAGLSKAPVMSASIGQSISGKRTTLNMDYAFPYNP